MKIICYGDSNTYGYDGDTVIGGRFPETERWPELLGQMLGCEVFNCGLNGRRVPRFQRSLEADLAQLRRWGDRALVIVMLGTNDILAGAEAEDTAAHMRAFITALTAAMPESAVLLCAPPAVQAEGGVFDQAFLALADAYERLADELELIYVNTLPWQIPTGGDGVHFTARGHRLFAMKLGQTLKEALQ